MSILNVHDSISRMSNLICSKKNTLNLETYANIKIRASVSTKLSQRMKLF